MGNVQAVPMEPGAICVIKRVQSHALGELVTKIPDNANVWKVYIWTQKTTYVKSARRAVRNVPRRQAVQSVRKVNTEIFVKIAVSQTALSVRRTGFGTRIHTCIIDVTTKNVKRDIT